MGRFQGNALTDLTWTRLSRGVLSPRHHSLSCLALHKAYMAHIPQAQNAVLDGIEGPDCEIRRGFRQGRLRFTAAGSRAPAAAAA